MMNIHNACRLCLHIGKVMCPLHDCLIDEINSVGVVDFLKQYTKINITFDEGKPDQICCDCYTEIERIYSFILRCEKTESALKQLKSAQGHLNKLKEIEIYAEDSDSSDEVIEIPDDEENGWTECDSASLHPAYDEGPSKSSEQIIVTPDVICMEEETKFGLEPIQAAPADVKPTGKRKRSTTQGKSQSKSCDICLRVFKHKKNLKRHMQTVHSAVDQSIRCKICFRTYRNKDSLRSHTLTAHPEGKLVVQQETTESIRCSKCPKQFEDYPSYRIHLDSTHKEFICEHCSKSFIWPSELLDHTEATEKGTFQCELCSRKFERKSCYNFHLEAHNKGAQVKCKVCFKTFTNRVALENHVEDVHGAEPLRCKICSKQFRTKYSLGYHIRATHSDSAESAGVQM